MKRQLMLAVAVVLLLSGWLSAFFLTSMPQQTNLYILFPTLLLGIGMGLTVKLLGNRRMALVMALTALTALLAINQVFPGRGSSLNLFSHAQPAAVGEGHPVRVELPQGSSGEEQTLEAFAPVRMTRFAKLPGPPRMMAFGPEQQLYVSIPRLGAIYRLTDSDGDGFSDRPQLYYSGLDQPHGLLWDDERLYVAETSRLLSLHDDNGDGQADREETVVEGLPDDGGHWTRTIVQDRQGQIYLSVGSRCNACEERDERRATILRVDPQSGQVTIHARGLRNSVGLALAPDSDDLWASDNGRDMLGDELPPDEINRIVAGGDYGWPFCFGQQVPDPQLGTAEVCRQTRPSAVDLPAHMAPLGIDFGSGLKAPARYRDSLYVASHGSWNRSVPRGYKLLRIPYSDGRMAESGQEFVRGWLDQGQAWGRPVAPLVGPDGNLYLSDDRAEVIYRISFLEQAS